MIVEKQIFSVEIIETLSETIKIKARCKEEALEKVQKEYAKEEIVLNSSHHITTEFLLKRR